MRRLLLLPLALGAVVFGCGSDEAGTPAACLSAPRTYLEALERAPQPVRLERSTPISECLVPGQDPAALAAVGQATVEAARSLNARVRRDPTGESAVRLGYLIGAVQEGAAATGGIHADLVRRLDRAARFSPGRTGFSAGFERAFGKGYAAGQENG